MGNRRGTRAVVPGAMMVHPSPSPLATPEPGPKPARALLAGRDGDQAWRLLAAGDRVRLGECGPCRIIHLDGTRAWVSGPGDGGHRLVAARWLHLVQPANPGSPGLC